MLERLGFEKRKLRLEEKEFSGILTKTLKSQINGLEQELNKTTGNNHATLWNRGKLQLLPKYIFVKHAGGCFSDGSFCSSPRQ